MKILASSDFHGNLPVIANPFDLFLIGGDICPAYNHSINFQSEWILTMFANWINALPFKDNNSKVVMIWGNHDFIGENGSEDVVNELKDKTKGRLEILSDSSYEYEFPVSDGIDSLKIYGTPACSQFYNWAFMYPDDKLEEIYSKIPEDTDILMTHDSPNIHMLGAITEGRYKNDTTGNKLLPKHIERVKPLLYVCGHFHSGNHEFKEYDGTYMANVSYINETYKPAHSVLEINYNEETREIEK